RVVFSLLLGLGLIWVQPDYAQIVGADCEEQRFNTFLQADSQYTNTFRSWYFGEPVSCLQECQQQCNSIIDLTERNTCIGECLKRCNNSRYSAFINAQDALMQAASQSCPYNPDACDAARARRDQCIATMDAHWQAPVYDENGNIDSTWWSFVIEEYFACWSASGVSNCE
ncbi:MAG: hypothetical protein AB1489_24275, partial [Acidobacteriota bacterium]